MSHTCVCPFCGKKSSSNELTFDFTDIFRQRKALFFERCTDDEKSAHLTNFDRLMNLWSQPGARMSLRPTYLSEDMLWNNTSGTRELAGLEGNLVLENSSWKEMLARSLKENPPFEDESCMETLQFMADPKSNFASSGYALQMFVKLHKDGDGDIRIGVVRDGAGVPIVTRRSCPRCAKELSHWAGRYRELVLTVLGSPRISKTTALAACAHVFTSATTDGTISWQPYGAKNESDPIGDTSWYKFEENCLNHYKANRKVDATNVGDQEAIPRFSVKVTVGGEEPLILTIVDIPGEYNQANEYVGLAPEVYREYEELYKHIDCVWFCTDPAELGQIDLNNEEEKRAKYGFDAGKTLATTDQLVNRIDQLNSLFRDEVPIAFIYGKSDTVNFDDAQNKQYKDVLYNCEYAPGLLSRSKWGRKDGNNPVVIEDAFCRRVSHLREFLVSVNSRVIKKFETAFPCHAFFATSNYGHGFDQQGNPMGDELKPFQPEVAFVWMLAMYGIVKTEEGTEQYRATSNPITRKNLGMMGTGGYTRHHKAQNKLGRNVSGFFTKLKDVLTGGG